MWLLGASSPHGPSPFPAPAPRLRRVHRMALLESVLARLDSPGRRGSCQGSPLSKPTTDSSPLIATGQVVKAGGRLPALDGLRGFALLGMLAWHAQLEWVRGGFARMTIFFVLSGYLASSSLVRLRDAGGTHPAVTYLRRRARRLVPMMLVGVALAIAVTSAVGSVAARRSMQGDVLAVLGGVSNWRFIFDVRAYGAMFESPSTLQHFWSLSAEEQCMWLLPLALLGASAIARLRSWLPIAVSAAALLAIPVVVTQSPDAIYYGTPNRAGEFFAGAAFALWYGSRRTNAPGALRFTRHLGTVSLVALVFVMAVVDRSTPWLYRGGLALMVLPVLGVLAAIRTEGGLVVRVLSIWPLAALGRWALSIYVIHWPLFVLMGEGRVGLSGWSLAVAEILVALAVGTALHFLVERPLLGGSLPSLRHRTAPSRPAWIVRDRFLFSVMAGGALVLAVIAFAVPVPPPVYDFEVAQARANQQPSTTVAPAPGVEGSVSGAPSPSRVLNLGVFGGSTGVLLGAAVFDWASQIPEVQAVPAWSHYGCGFLTNGEYLGRAPDGTAERVRPDPACSDWQRSWLEATEQNRIQVAVVVTGVWETTDWVFDGREAPSTINDSDFDDLIRSQITQALDELTSRGVNVIITTAPNIGPGTTGDARAARGLPDDHPQRVQVYNQILRSIAADRSAVSVIDYGTYIDGFSRDQSAEWLPDGIHPTDEAARRIWLEYLGPALRSTIRETWPALYDS